MENLEDSDQQIELVRSFLAQQSQLGLSVIPYDDSDAEEIERLERVKSLLAMQRASSTPTKPSTHIPTKPTISSELKRAQAKLTNSAAVVPHATSKSSTGSVSSMENEYAAEYRFKDPSTVFNRLYSMHKSKASNILVVKEENRFQPRIDSKSRAIAESSYRPSLYERALEQRFRQESARETQERQEQEDRSRPKTLHASQDLAWKRLRREIEELFAARLKTTQNGQTGENADDIVMALTQDMFNDVARCLNLHEVSEDLFLMLSSEDSQLIHLAPFCSFIKHVFNPPVDAPLTDDFSIKVKRLLVGKKAIQSTIGIERALQKAAAETPFSPQITNKSRQLDEQRYMRMGIDPSLPRSDKIHAELKIFAEKKETKKLLQSKKEMEGCTFRPKTNSISSANASPVKSASTSQVRTGNSRVGDRLYTDSLERRAKMSRLKEERQAAAANEMTAECTFRPKINSTRTSSVTSVPTLSIMDTPLRARAFEMSVERLKRWRDKHVVHEDTADLAYSTKKKQQELNVQRRSVAKKSAPAHSSHMSRLTRPIIFEAEVALPNESSTLIQVKEGDNLVRVAESFAKRHNLDKIAECALLKTLQQNVAQESSQVLEGDESFNEEPSGIDADITENDNDEEEESFLVIDVLVRPGETYELRLSSEDDPIQVALEFAADVGMDDAARDRLIESLSQLEM